MKKLKYLIIVLLCLFVNINTINAKVSAYIDEDEESISINERLEENNYGVNKKWKITSKNKSNVLNTPLVDAKEKIYDFANILDEDEIDELYDDISDFIFKTGMDMIILTVDEEYYFDEVNETIAADFYDYNDFGIDDKYYSGILLLRNTYEDDPYFNIYTFGEAQLYFNYDRLENVLDDIYDDLHNHNYLDGFKKFVSEIDNYYDMGMTNKYKYAYINDIGDVVFRFRPPYVLCTIASLIITTIIIAILVRKNRMIRKATRAEVYIDKSSINYTKRENRFITSHTTHYTVSSSSGGGGGSSHGSSGGGHSSGGGRHG